MTAARRAAEPSDGGAGWLGRRLGDWSLWEVALLAAVTACGLALRLHAYTEAPAFTDNADEVQFPWAGLNLILHGDAITWSPYAAYAVHTVFHANGVVYHLVHHWMDHPPLFALLMGGWVWLLGDRTMLQVTAAQVRIPAIVFSTASLPLAHLLGRRMLPRAASLLGVALLAVSPAAVLLGREPEPESLQALLLLAALLLTLRVLEGRAGAWTWTGLLLGCLTAPLLKVTGIAVAGICAVILLAAGRWRAAPAVAASGAAGLLGFVLYGWLVDWQLFVRVWEAQNANRTGMLAAWAFIASPAGVNRSLHDGWWLLGWVGLGLLAAGRVRRRELFGVWPPVAYALLMMVVAGQAEAGQYGWYRVIVYPSVYLAAGWLAWEAVAGTSLPRLALLLGLGGATATNWWLAGPYAAWVPNPGLLVVLVGAVLLPAAILGAGREDRWLRRLAVCAAWVAMATMLVGNVVESVWLPQIFVRM
jgi:uncharacterized membrane protein